MSNLSQKTTIYLNPYIKKYLQYRSVQEARSVSEIINDQFSELLEDLDDLQKLEERKNDPLVPWEQVKKELGLNAQI